MNRFKEKNYMKIGFSICLPIGLILGIMFGAKIGKMGAGIALGFIIGGGFATALGSVMEAKFKR